MVDTTPETIKKIFYQQIRNLTLKNHEIMDYQFSDRWLSSMLAKINEVY